MAIAANAWKMPKGRVLRLFVINGWGHVCVFGWESLLYGEGHTEEHYGTTQAVPQFRLSYIYHGLSSSYVKYKIAK